MCHSSRSSDDAILFSFLFVNKACVFGKGGNVHVFRCAFGLSSWTILRSQIDAGLL